MNKQAIMIIAHNNIWTLKKIIELLDSKYFDIFIHIDKKSNLNPEELKNICKESKLFIYKEINVRWADYSQVECELFLLDQATKKHSYDYYHLLSGADMPLKKAEEIYNFFRIHQGKEFVHFESQKTSDEKLQRIKYYYTFIKLKRKSKLLRIMEICSIFLQKIFFINRLRNNNLSIKCGAQWFSITNNFAKYLLDHKTIIEKTFHHTYAPDEEVIQTMLYNSNFINNLYYDKYDDNYKACARSIDWKRGNPYTYTINDLDELLASENMFARKFDENKDKEIIEAISKKLEEDK